MRSIDPEIPEDFDERSKEFWEYVDERVKAAGSALARIYLESSGVPGKRELNMLKINNPSQHEVVQHAMEQGAEIVQAEDPELVLETMSWMQKLHELSSSSSSREDLESKLQTISQFLQESMVERNQHVKKRIDETLEEGEMGLLFMDMSRDLDLPKDIRVIITCPFRPHDYLNSWLASLRAKRQGETPYSEEE